MESWVVGQFPITRLVRSLATYRWQFRGSRITSALPTNRKLARSVKTSAFLGTNISREGSTGRLLGQNIYPALNRLWRLSECPDEGTPHPLAISKAVLPGNFLGGEAASLHHQPCRFHAQPFNCLRG
jgi:hypothetical protein